MKLKIIVSFILILFMTSYSNSQYCDSNNCVWLENDVIISLQQFPGCSLKVVFEQAVCSPERCITRIKEVVILGGVNCPTPNQLTIPEYLRIVAETILSVRSYIVRLTECHMPTQDIPTKTYEIWYKSPCWQWVGLNNPSGPPPSIVPCLAEGCCKVTYLVHYINENTFQPVRLFQQVVGLCQPSYPGCINNCE